MSTRRCPSCGQENPEAAVLCEFCKALFTAPPVSTRLPRPLDRPPPQPTGWTTPQVVGVALASLVTGFFVRSALAWRSAPPPVAVAAVTTRAAPVAEAPPSPAPVDPAPTEEQPAPPSPPTEHPTLAIAPAPPTERPALAVAPAPPEQDAGSPLAPRQIRVPYQPYEGSAHRVLIPVTLGRSTKATMLLDTGAPGTVISAALAERLGVLRADEGRLVTRAGGIGGQTAAVLLVLDSLSVEDARTEFVPATVVDNLPGAFEGLVGMDFLGNYEVRIDTAQHVLVLTENPQVDSPGGHDERWWRNTFGHFLDEKSEWERVRAFLKERLARSEAPPGLTLEETQRYYDFAQYQCHQLELLTDRLERHASLHAVPRQWRSR